MPFGRSPSLDPAKSKGVTAVAPMIGESSSVTGTFPKAELLLRSGDEAGTAPDDRAYRPDVQGMRAVAVLLVVFSHVGIPGMSRGVIGVDVFFVISGYLITRWLLRKKSRAGRIAFSQFYAARARRILPAL